MKCIKCGATNYARSYGGPSICPSCDCGLPSMQQLAGGAFYPQVNNYGAQAYRPVTSNEDAVDAARYRWLRVHSTGPVEPWSTHDSPESLDAIIDSAMAAEGGRP